MSRYQSYLNTAVTIIERYKGEKPFAFFAREFFSANKKYGSKDRKQISSLCYNYFRIGHAGKELPVEEKLLIGLFLCGNEPSDILEYKRPEWNSKMQLPVNKKIRLLAASFLPAAVFPFGETLSNGIDADKFCQSFFIQPDLFLRIRPKLSGTVMKKLEKTAFPYKLVGNNCVALPNATNIDDHFTIDREVVVQDYTSQQVLNYLDPAFTKLTEKDRKEVMVPGIWDCCAASGGKSILLYDLLQGKLELTVSDIRLSILLNLHQRFKKAGIKSYKYFVADVTSANCECPATPQDMILCDAPCTGSGTWSRTPEQLCFFDETTITAFSQRQKQIVTNVIPHLKKAGLFVYITCSVFKEENEAVADYIVETLQLKLLHQELLKGYDKKADSMFVAIFKK